MNELVFNWICYCNNCIGDDGAAVEQKGRGGEMSLLLTVVAAASTISSIEAFTSGAILGATLYTASRTNKVVRHRKK